VRVRLDRCGARAPWPARGQGEGVSVLGPQCRARSCTVRGWRVRVCTGTQGAVWARWVAQRRWSNMVGVRRTVGLGPIYLVELIEGFQARLVAK
jgi:hypothetical protein